MSDLIRRGDVLDALIEKGQKSKRYKWGDRWELNLFEIKEAVESVPSAKPEQKKGKWEYPRKFGHTHLLGKCSVCGKYEGTEWIVLDNPNFCPHCGADMRSEHEL